MTEAELRSQLKPMIAKLIEVDQFRDDEHFVRDLGVDSMMALEMVSRIERLYHIRIAEEMLRHIATFNDVVRITLEVVNAPASEVATEDGHK